MQKINDETLRFKMEKYVKNKIWQIRITNQKMHTKNHYTGEDTQNNAAKKKLKNDYFFLIIQQ